jgi:hypothetical protein
MGYKWRPIVMFINRFDMNTSLIYFPLFGTRYELPMRRMRLPAQTLNARRMRENLASLLGQGRHCLSELVLPGHTDSQDLLGFLPRRRPAKRRQPKGDASRLRYFAHPVALAHSEQRLDGIGADWQSHVIEPSGLGRLKLVVQIGTKLLADGGGGHRGNACFALGDSGPPQPPGFENLLASQ